MYARSEVRRTERYVVEHRSDSVKACQFWMFAKNPTQGSRVGEQRRADKPWLVGVSAEHVTHVTIMNVYDSLLNVNIKYDQPREGRI